MVSGVSWQQSATVNSSYQYIGKKWAQRCPINCNMNISCVLFLVCSSSLIYIWTAVLFQPVHDLPTGQKTVSESVCLYLWWCTPVLCLNSATNFASIEFPNDSECTVKAGAGREEPRFGGPCVEGGVAGELPLLWCSTGLQLHGCRQRKARIWLWKGRKSAVFMPCLASPTLAAQ